MSKIYIVRHGISQHNAGITSFLDSPLTEDGCLQAIAAGKCIQSSLNAGPITIRTSPMLRCLMTTKFLLEGLIRQDDQREVNVIVEPQIHESLSPNAGEVIVPNRQEHFDYDWRLMPDSILVGADDGRRLMNRSKCVIKSIDEEQVILVSHGASCIALGLAATGIYQMTDWDHSINNGSVTYIKNGKKVWWGLVPFVAPFVGRESYTDFCSQDFGNGKCVE